MPFPRLQIIALGVVALALSTSTVSQAPATYAEAEALVRAGQLDQGIAMAKQILETDPKNLKTLNLTGIALSSKGDLDGANREYHKALEIDPTFYHALKNLAVNELAQKNITKAKNHLMQALQFAPHDVAIHVYLGKIAYAQHDYNTAAAHLAKTNVAKDPEIASELADSDLRSGHQERAQETLRQFKVTDFIDSQQFRIGLALAGREMFQEAIPYFQAVSARHPESYDAAFNLAVCLIESKQFAPAVQVLGAVADRGHKTAELDNLLAEAYEGNNQTQEAINTLREATQVDPQDEDNFVDLAALCTNYEAFQIGLEVIEAGLHYHPQSDRLIFQRGVIYAMTNKFDLAEQNFQIAARLAPEKNLSYVAMGVSYMQTGNLPKAIAELRQRIRRKRSDATLHYLLGEALIRSGVVPADAAFLEAKSALEKSVTLNPRFAPAHVNLAKIYLKQNRVDDAIAHLEAARALDPKDKSAYSQLAIAYRRQGNRQMSSTMLAALNKLNEEERAEAGHRKRLHAGTEANSPQPIP